MISKDLEGATVEKVDYAVNKSSWLPVIGERFDTWAEAKAYAKTLKAEHHIATVTIETRITFRYLDGSASDVPMGRDTIYL